MEHSNSIKRQQNAKTKVNNKAIIVKNSKLKKTNLKLKYGRFRVPRVDLDLIQSPPASFSQIGPITKIPLENVSTVFRLMEPFNNFREKTKSLRHFGGF